MPTIGISLIYLTAKPPPRRQRIHANPSPEPTSSDTHEKSMGALRSFCNGLAELDWIGAFLVLAFVTCFVVSLLLCMRSSTDLSLRAPDSCSCSGAGIRVSLQHSLGIKHYGANLCQNLRALGLGACHSGMLCPYSRMKNSCS